MTSFEDMKLLAQVWVDLELGDVVRTAFGALVGALFAFKLATFEKRKTRISDELKLINTAFAAVSSNLNTMANFKRQIALPKKSELDLLTKELEGWEAAKQTGEDLPKALVLQVRQSLKQIQPLELLSGTILENVSSLRFIAGRPLIFAMLCEKAFTSLNKSIEDHNSLVVDLKSHSNDDEIVLFKICGLVLANGHVDESYRNYVESMGDSADESLFFLHDILETLWKHGERVRRIGDSKGTKLLKFGGAVELYKDIMPTSGVFQSWDDVPVVSYKLD